MQRKHEERAFLDTLALLYPEFPDGRIIPSESPDFIIRSGKKHTTGIEVTLLTKKEYNWLEGKALHFLPSLSRDHLVEMIRYKEEKIGLYRSKKLNEIWLLIIAKGLSNPAHFNITNQLENWHIDSSFDRVLLIELKRNRLVEVYRDPNS